ncbi:hypothetical protein [Pseudogracilibacillus auburnensis]|uniref:hypothetical protein n=1 Tax=Pseudogracilibacillus auburnensis TaxID=1494959 RepID=UPI001A956E7F|nr:hypothetical protein [Pseudogracilibacillus auburnensis]MBO1005772.1 hypothetical protein [Pseudogracilibacillus auburnensis]
MFRPTVRCSDVYRDYLHSLRDAIGLDSNQIIRLALFSAPFSRLFVAQIKNKTGDVSLPHPSWEVFEEWLWLEQDPNIEEKRRSDVSVNDGGTEKITSYHENFEQRGIIREEIQRPRRQQQEQGRIREVQPGGGIRIRIS